MRVALIVAAIICLIPHARAAGPDQVLVLYNADYTVDQDDSAPGQDSKEVAEYYVRRHTDPLVLDLAGRIGGRAGLKRVCLSGGVFQNRLLLRMVVPRLEAAGFSVLTHRQAPANDGGISLGQAVIAHFTIDTPAQDSYNFN